MAQAKVKCQIFQAANLEWSFRIIRGSHIVLGPEETYKTRYGCRRAVKALADISTDNSLNSYVSQLQAACIRELRDEAYRWATRKRIANV